VTFSPRFPRRFFLVALMPVETSPARVYSNKRIFFSSE
jgi:hypothetical protein